MYTKCHCRKHGAVVQKQKRTPEAMLNRLTTWFNQNPDAVNDDVSMAIADMIHQVARGTPIGMSPARPKLLSHEVEVCVPKGPGSLLMNIGELNGRLFVLDFRKKADGSLGPAEATGKIKRGDVLVAINGLYMHQHGFKFMVQHLTSKDFPYLYLRFIRVPSHYNDKLGSIISECVNPPPGRRPFPLRSRYFGVFPLPDKKGKWVAETYDSYSPINLGVFDNETDAARAYDKYALEKHGESCCRLNFEIQPTDSSGESFVFSDKLTAAAAMLGRIVDGERNHNNQLAEEISDMEASVARSKSSVLGNGTSPDSRNVDANENETDGSDNSSEREFGVWASDDSYDSDSSIDPVEDSSSSSSEDDNADKNSSDSSDDGGNEWEEENKKDKEWRPKEELEAAGPIGRLLRAVNESDNRPFREDWENFILELGMIAPDLRDDDRPKRIEQIDIASGVTLKVWDTITAAAKALNVPVYTIGACTRGRVDTAGGFKWRVIYATDQEISANAAADEVLV